MALSTQPYKGARDFYPEDKRVQNYMFDTWRRVVERYGYEEYDAPILESLDIYLAKTSDEIVGEQTYTFKDRGGREVVIRPEMTPTVSRMVAARRQELAYPLRWYSIPNLWRYERPQRGRLREHWQLNVDIFGVAGTAAETEIITLVDAIFKEFGAKESMYEIRLNSRKLMNAVLGEYLGLKEKEQTVVAGLVDRLHKMEKTTFLSKVDAAISAQAKEDGAAEKLLKVLGVKNTRELPAELRRIEAAAAAIEELETMLADLKIGGVGNVLFDPSVMRGFNYYTDIVFEVFDLHPDNNRAMLGGGRYDGLVGLFGVKPVPTVGFGWGDVTLANFLELHRLLPALPPATDVYAVVIGDIAAAAGKPVGELRAKGVNVAVDFSGRKPGDQLKAADKKGIEYVLVIGEDELKSGRYKLKNLASGREEALTVAAIAQKFKRAA